MAIHVHQPRKRKEPKHLTGTERARERRYLRLKAGGATAESPELAALIALIGPGRRHRRREARRRGAADPV